MGEKEARRLLDELIKKSELNQLSPEEEEILRRYPDVWEDYILFKAFRRMEGQQHSTSGATESDWRNYFSSKRRKYRIWLYAGVAAVVVLVFMMFVFEPTVSYFYSHGLYPGRFFRWYFGGAGRRLCGMGLHSGVGLHIIFYMHFVAPFLVIGLVVFAVVMLIKAVRF